MTTNQHPRTPDELPEFERLGMELELESRRWNQLRIHPGRINFDLFLISSKLNAIITILIDMEFTTPLEFNITQRKMMLQELQGLREQLEAENLKGTGPSLIGPDGRPLVQ